MLLCCGLSWGCFCPALCSPCRAHANPLLLVPKSLLPQEPMVLPDIVLLLSPVFLLALST